MKGSNTKQYNYILRDVMSPNISQCEVGGSRELICTGSDPQRQSNIYAFSYSYQTNRCVFVLMHQ